MTLDQVYRKCLTMTPGQGRSFTLSEEPAQGELSLLTARVAVTREKRKKMGSVSFLRNGLELSASCYIPKV